MPAETAIVNAPGFPVALANVSGVENPGKGAAPNMNLGPRTFLAGTAVVFLILAATAWIALADRIEARFDDGTAAVSRAVEGYRIDPDLAPDPRDRQPDSSGENQ